MYIEKVDNIFSDGNHNAFTDIDLWKGRYYVVFRSSDSHASPHEGVHNMNLSSGHITLMDSSDCRNWSSSVVFDTRWDDRDPKLLATKDRLYIFATCLHGEGYREASQETLASYTEDGCNWSDPVSAYRYNYGFWKPKKYKGAYYVAADVDDLSPGISLQHKGRVELLRSEDGLHWQSVSVISTGNSCTETAIVFLKDALLVAIIRQKMPMGVLISEPPYKDWTQMDGDSHFGIQGPAAELVGDTVLVSCRVRKSMFPDDQPGVARTAIFTLNVETGALQWQMNLPTQWGGDVSYAGILPVGDDRVLISYYDGEPYQPDVPQRSDIMLATIVMS